MFEYKTHGTCSTQNDPKIEDGVIPCRGATSCPDQLARAIDAYEQQELK